MACSYFRDDDASPVQHRQAESPGPEYPMTRRMGTQPCVGGWRLQLVKAGADQPDTVTDSRGGHIDARMRPFRKRGAGGPLFVLVLAG